MLFGLLAGATVVVHFAVLGYLVFGGFLAWRYRWTLVPHVAMVVWGALIVVEWVDCPLTALQNWARREAGAPTVARGFIDTYVTGVLYPAADVVLVRGIVAVIVAVSWLGLLVRSRRVQRV